MGMVSEGKLPVSSSTKGLYDAVYEPTHVSQYGHQQIEGRNTRLLACVKDYIQRLQIHDAANVLEIGAAFGGLHTVHPNWRGVEYSRSAIRRGKEIFGADLNVVEADARALPVADGSIDFLFSFATLEHIPRLEEVFQEIERVLKPGGYALLSPAWNCRAWTVKKLQQRPYAELTLSEKIGKWLIPLRDSLPFRLLCSLPGRIRRELRLALGAPVALEYRRLQPDFSLWDRYPHISDDDAFVSIDAHAALTYFRAMGWRLLSHPTFFSRFASRGAEIVLQKQPRA